MLSGVSITCFAASYAIALILEISRLFFRSGIRGAIMLAFAGAGLLAHTVFLAHRATEAVGSPLSSKQDWYLIAAWVLVVVYLYLTAYHPKTAFGVFLLPLALTLVGVGAWLADAEPFAREPASQVWGTIHGTSVLLATVAVIVGFAAGVMYLGQAYRLKHKLPPQRGLRLPSLEWLQRANSRAIVISMILLGIGILSGVILNLINDRHHTHRVPWNDPFIVSTVIMFGWLLLSSAIGLFYRPAREGHRVAYLTVVSFLFLVIALSIGLFHTQHGGGTRTPVESTPRRGASLERHDATARGLEAWSLAQASEFRVGEFAGHRGQVLNPESCTLGLRAAAEGPSVDSWELGIRLRACAFRPAALTAGRSLQFASSSPFDAHPGRSFV